MKLNQLNRRIDELSKKLKPKPSGGVRLDFSSFSEPEQLIILKNAELDEKYAGRWTKEVILENKDVIVKYNHVVLTRVLELFDFAVPRVLMLDEVERWFFRLHVNLFWTRWLECQKNVDKWSEKDREEFLCDIKGEWKNEKKHKKEVLVDGENNN